MYSMVLMVAVTTGGDAPSFGKDRGGCTGMTAGCHGGGFLGLRDRGGCHGLGDRGGCHGFLGLRDGDGLFGKHKNRGGCHGVTSAGCQGTPSAPTVPVVVVPTGCQGAFYAGTGCHGGGLGLRDRGGCHGFLGLRGGRGGCHGW